MTRAADPRSRRNRTVSALAACSVAALTVVLAMPGSAHAVASRGEFAWNFKQIRVTHDVQQAGHDGRGVVVAVIDTWVDGSNSVEFGGRVLAGADCANHNGSCIPGPAKHDDCGHGTHVAGTIASTNWGVAPGVKIMPVRVLVDPDGRHPDECTGSTDDVAAGIRWADDHGARVINLSLAAVKGVATASPVTFAVQRAVEHNRVVVFAAGNSDRPVADSYGGHALIVAATGPSGGLAAYSQHGAGVSVAAPGGDPRRAACAGDGSDCVVSTWLGKQYAALAGTSMAAPHVSGLAALLISQHPGRSEANVVATIEGTAHPLHGGGSGRIDAASALGVTTTGTPTHRPVAPPAAPTHKPKVQANGTTHPPTRVRPAPKGTGKRALHGKPGAATTVRGLPAQPSADGGKGLPLVPPVAAAALLVGLGAGLLTVRRKPTA